MSAIQYFSVYTEYYIMWYKRFSLIYFRRITSQMSSFALHHILELEEIEYYYYI